MVCVFGLFSKSPKGRRTAVSSSLLCAVFLGFESNFQKCSLMCYLLSTPHTSYDSIYRENRCDFHVPALVFRRSVSPVFLSLFLGFPTPSSLLLSGSFLFSSPLCCSHCLYLDLGTAWTVFRCLLFCVWQTRRKAGRAMLSPKVPVNASRSPKPRGLCLPTPLKVAPSSGAPLRLCVSRCLCLKLFVALSSVWLSVSVAL